jgi:hypothetical protein
VNHGDTTEKSAIIGSINAGDGWPINYWVDNKLSDSEEDPEEKSVLSEESDYAQKTRKCGFSHAELRIWHRRLTSPECSFHIHSTFQAASGVCFSDVTSLMYSVHCTIGFYRRAPIHGTGNWRTPRPIAGLVRRKLPLTIRDRHDVMWKQTRMGRSIASPLRIPVTPTCFHVAGGNAATNLLAFLNPLRSVLDATGFLSGTSS